MTTIYQHITDPASYRLSGGETVEDVCIECTGSRIGRVLFTEWAPCIEITGGPVLIQGTVILGGSIGVRVS